MHLQGPSHLFGEDSDDGTTGGTCLHADAGTHGDGTEAGETEGGAAQTSAGDLPTPPAASNGADRTTGGSAAPHASDGRQKQHVALDIEAPGARAAANDDASWRTAPAQRLHNGHDGQ